MYRADALKEQFDTALAAAGVEKRPLPFHDLRHSALTHLAAAGASPTVLMTTAGHSDYRTTKRYVHLAGVVLRDEAAALEKRLLGGAPSQASGSPTR